MSSISIGLRADVSGLAIYGMCADAVGNINNNMNKITIVRIELRLVLVYKKNIEIVVSTIPSDGLSAGDAHTRTV